MFQHRQEVSGDIESVKGSYDYADEARFRRKVDYVAVHNRHRLNHSKQSNERSVSAQSSVNALFIVHLPAAVTRNLQSRLYNLPI